MKRRTAQTATMKTEWKANKRIIVDGTSGFIRHQQYAVCLALIVDGQVEMGVIGCPNLGPEPAALGEEIMPNGKGVLMVAVRGEGSYSVCSFNLESVQYVTSHHLLSYYESSYRVPLC